MFQLQSSGQVVEFSPADSSHILSPQLGIVGACWGFISNVSEFVTSPEVAVIVVFPAS